MTKADLSDIHHPITLWIIDDANILQNPLINSQTPSCYLFTTQSLPQSQILLSYLKTFDGVVPITIGSNQHTTAKANQQHFLPQVAITKKMAQTLELLPKLPHHTVSWQNFRQFLNMAHPTFTNTLSRAIQLLRWQTDYRFCGRCGHQTIASIKEVVKICPKCSHHQYPRIQPCVITAIYRHHQSTGKKQILLAHHHRHRNPSTTPMYGLIAGFVEVGESLENAVQREVMEEVGIHIHQPKYFASQAWPFPSNLMLGFTAQYQSGHITLQVDELADAQFFDIDDLPKIPQKGTIARTLIDHIIAT